MKFEGARARNFVEQFFFVVSILVFFGSQEYVKKIGPKKGFSLNWSSHPSGISTVKIGGCCMQIPLPFSILMGVTGIGKKSSGVFGAFWRPRKAP
jgi:hypothetical protein